MVLYEFIMFLAQRSSDMRACHTEGANICIDRWRYMILFMFIWVCLVCSTMFMWHEGLPHTEGATIYIEKKSNWHYPVFRVRFGIVPGSVFIICVYMIGGGGGGWVAVVCGRILSFSWWYMFFNVSAVLLCCILFVLHFLWTCCKKNDTPNDTLLFKMWVRSDPPPISQDSGLQIYKF
jgi:hypothetical protein